MIELGIQIIVLAAIGVVCGIASIVISCEEEEYEYEDYCKKDDPEYKGGNEEDGR